MDLATGETVLEAVKLAVTGEVSWRIGFSSALCPDAQLACVSVLRKLIACP